MSRDILDTPEFRMAAAKVRALGEVLKRIDKRPGSKAPSTAVVRAAAGIHADGAAIIAYVGDCLLRYVKSGDRTYKVVLKIQNHGPESAPHPYSIIDAECTCTAADTGKTCKHLLAVLASEEHDGHHLEI